MTMLPDIDEGTYTDWAQDDFKRKAKEKQDSFGGFLGGIGDQVGQFAGGAGEAIGGAASGLGSTIDQQRQQLQSAMSQIAPTAQAPSAEVAASQVPPQPAAALPAAAPGALAPPEPAGLDIDSQRQQLQAAISQRQPDLAPTQDFGQTLDAQRQQLQSAIGQLGPMLQHANQPPLAQPQQGGDLQSYARQAAQRAGVDPDIFVRQIQQESGFDPNAGSPAGARGIAQIVPKYHPGVDVTDPYASLDYAANLMKSNVSRYGGDYAKALAAYNAGAGAVEQYGGVPPFQETQTYIKNILGGAGQAIGGAARAIGQKVSDISQFGDPQLSNDEAYAACGPAAAVRFAQRFGRNPTLREATDLASSVGWSSGQGMAGIGSEQALMTKLGVPTTLVQGPQWDRIAAEAQTGNPVTISTQGHYFYADSYNPQTGQFHVGRSGTDLRNGSEWMTAEQMTSAMGPVQGALLANNPTVSAPSTADSNRTYGANGIFDQAIASATSAADQGLAALRGSVEQGLQRGRSWADEQARNLDQAVQQAGLAPTQTRLPVDVSDPAAIAGINTRADALGVMQALPTSPTVEAQLAGRENAQLGPFTIPGQVAGPVGAASEWLREHSPLTQASRFTSGQAQIQGADPALQNLMAEQVRLRDEAIQNPSAETLAAYKQAEQRVTDYNDQLLAGITPAQAYEAAFRSPERVGEEDWANAVGSIASMAVAPEGLASGAGRFISSLALDPQGAPFNVAGEGLAKLGGAAVRALGVGAREAPRAGEAAQFIEPAERTAAAAGGLGTPRYALEEGTPEFGISNALRQAAEADPNGVARLTSEEMQALPGMPNPGAKYAWQAGQAPALDDLRVAIDNGIGQARWYSDFARNAEQLVGRDNINEFRTLFGITSQQTPPTENLQYTLGFMQMAREFTEQGLSFTPENIGKWVAGHPRVTSLGESGAWKVNTDQFKKVARLYTEGAVDVASNAKTSSYSQNILSALQNRFDPNSTMDVWMQRLFNYRNAGTSAVSGSDPAFRAQRAVIDHLAGELGIVPHQAQAAAWFSIKAAQDFADSAAAPAAFKRLMSGYKAGDATLNQVIEAARDLGVYRTESLRGTWAEVAGDLGVQDQIAKLRPILDRARPAAADDAFLRFPGKGKQPFAVSPTLTAERRGLAESQAPVVAAKIGEDALRQLGYNAERGQFEALGTIPHQVETVGDQVQIRIPGGNADALQFVGAVVNRQGGADSMNIHIFRPEGRDLAGWQVVGPDGARLSQDVVERLKSALDVEKVQYSDAGEGIIRVHALPVADPAYEARVADALQSVGDLRTQDLQGVAANVGAENYEAIIGRFEPRFGAPGLTRVPGGERGLGGLVEAGAGLGSQAAEAGRAQEAGLGFLPGAAHAVPRPLQGAIGGGIAGGYGASQEEGATPADVARGVATGIPLGVARAVLPGSALRNVARLGAIAERTQGEGGIFDSPEVARLMDLARGRGVDPAELLQREITRLQNVPAHLAENAAPRLDNLRGALDELTNPLPQKATAAVEGVAPEAARAAEEVAPTAAELLRPPELSDGAREFAGNLRLGKYVPAEVRDIIATVYDTNPDVMEAARRGVVPDQVVRDMAQEFGAKNVDAVVKRWKHGGAENAETIYALRQAMANEGQNVLAAQRGLRRTPESADARLALVNAVTRMQSIEEAVAGYTAEAGRAVRQFRDPIEGQNAMLARLIKVARSKSMNVEELVNEISEIPLEDPKEALKLARALNPTSKWEKAWALWYFGLLSTPMTHLRNMSSNAVTAGMTPVESLSAAAHDPLARAAFKAVGAQTSGRERFFGEALQDIKGLAKPLYSREAGLAEQDADAVGLTAGLPQGFRRALRAYANEGVTAEDILSGHAHPEAWQGAAGAVIHAPGRGLRGEDAFFKALNESAAGHRMAYREAMRAGLGRDPEGLAAYMAELLHNPDPKFIEEVIRQGKYRTFNADSGVANSLIRLRNDVPALRAIMPFVRTPWNITKFVAERSPAGYLGILKDLGAARLTTSGRESLQAKGVGDLADRMGRATMGSLIAAGISHYAGDNLTGRAPDDPTERDAFYRQGKQPYSMKIGNTWQSYQPLQPYAPIFAGVANMKEQLRKDPKAGDNMLGMAGSLSLAMAQGLFDMPWTQGLADAIDLFQAGGGPGSDTQAKFGRLVEQQAGSAIPGMVRAFARAHDQTIRDPQNGLEAMAANIPFLEDRVAPKLDVWGAARKRPSGGVGSLINVFNPSEATRDPVEQGLSDLQLRGYQVEPGFVGKNMTERGLPVELSDEQQRAYQQSSGQAAYSVLSLVMGTKEWEALPSDKKAEFIEQVVRDTREYGRSRLIPELMPKFKESFEKLQQRAAGG